MTHSPKMTRLLMNRSKFEDLQLDSIEAPAAVEGEAVFRLDRFALTTNNITYAAFGDALGYWKFFPAGVAGFGLLPVWGYADVVESRVQGIDAGQRYYGYFPAATHLCVRPGKCSARSFRDDAAQRTGLPAVYNWYQRTDDDPLHDSESEPLQAIFRPLFVTAYGLADFLAEQGFFGAERIILSSASSRTGYATAFCIGQRAAIDLIGLTSAGHREFVAALGLYSDAIAYDAVEQLDPDVPTLYVDVAGNPELQLRVHRHFGERLVHDAALGAAHAQQPPEPAPGLPGPAPKFFFAPEWITHRQADWGTTGFEHRVGRAITRFLGHVITNQLIDIREHHGLESAREILIEMLDGRTDPAVGHVLRPRSG
jgi:hypothetical protein